MDALELRFYTREEIGALTGNTDLRDHHFKEKVLRVLDNQGYTYRWEPRKGVTILSHDQSALQRFRLLLTKHFGFDGQVDAYQYACYLAAYQEVPNFFSMPGEERVKAYAEYSGVAVAQSTMDGWRNRLADKGLMVRSRYGLTWKTQYDGCCMPQREVVDTSLPEYKEYNSKFAEMLSDGWGYGEAKTYLYKKYGYYLNRAPEWMPTAWGDDLSSKEVAELHRLALEVVHEHRQAVQVDGDEK